MTASDRTVNIAVRLDELDATIAPKEAAQPLPCGPDVGNHDETAESLADLAR